MRFTIGVQIQPQHAAFDAMREAWREAEALGADMIFTWDHFFPLSGDPDGRHYEGLTTLAAMAEATDRAQVGGLVFCNSYRNPQLLADAHRTIDQISGGRAILGIGAGWFERDYDEYGYQFGTAPDRLRALRRDLPLIRDRLARLNPPAAGPLPILIGGGGERVTLRLVAEHARLWHAFGGVDVYRHKAEVLAGHCERVGRDPAEIGHLWAIQPDALDGADALRAAGVSGLVVAVGGADGAYDLAPLAELLEWRDRLT